jgi:surface protein
MARANRSVVNSKPNSFISTWKTDNLATNSSTATQIRLPLSVSGSYNFMVYWGDNTSSSISSALQPDITHSYASAGAYFVTMSGYIKGFSFSNTPDRRKIINISQWGGIKLSSNGSQFQGCDALTLNNILDTPNLYSKNINPTFSASMAAMFRSCSLLTSISRLDQWDTSQVQFMGQTFYQANKFNQNIGSWNTSNVTNMDNMLGGPNITFTHSFNNGGSDSIKNWDTSKVTTFSQIFLYNPNFNQPIGSWNISSASILDFMFYYATGFNQPLNNWNTSNVTSMNSIFYSASSFNQPLSNWNTSKITSMGSMFYEARNFNQDIGSWDVSKVTNFSFMFGAIQPTPTITSSFNNGGSPSINNWNVSSASNMNAMFQYQINFNQPIGSWSMGNVTNTSYMLNVAGNTRFAGGTFNQPIGNWNLSKVTNAQFMMNGQALFDQNIGNWDLSKLVTASGMFKMLGSPYPSAIFNNGGSDSIRNWSMASASFINTMFENTYGFNQPVDNWNVSNVTNASSFMGTKSNLNYSASNYDALLIGWASRPVKPNISISFNNINYTIAASASRAILTSAPNNWTIVDGGQI